MSISNTSKKVVIAIDFGTSRSGYAYAFTANPKIVGRTEWPGQKVPYCKTLTHLLYDPDQSVLAWGWEAKRVLAEEIQFFDSTDYRFFEKFKMRLREHHLNSQARSDQEPSALNLTIDYLRLLKDLALEDVMGATAGHLQDQEILWCLTIPAIWTDAEKGLMRQAAQKAGLIKPGTSEDDCLLLVLEPEAAAIHCLNRERFNPDKAQLEVGHHFMIVDAGGGTVDITVHKILSDWRLEEIVPGSGGAYGSTYIDDEFKKYLEQRLGKEVIQQYEEEEPVGFLKMIEEWESQKCDFNPQRSGQSTNFPIPTSLYKLLSRKYPDVLQRLANEQMGADEYIYLDTPTMTQIFMPVIDGLIQVVENQFNILGQQQCDFIFLVGGFSSSPFLQHYIRKHFADRVKKIVIPPFPGAAIVEGAVAYGLNQAVIPVRRSRFTYGCSTSKPFESGRDPEEKKIFSTYTGGWYCENRFDIFVTAGESVRAGKKSKPKTFEPQQKDQTKIEFGFYATPKKEVRYIDEDGVKKIGNLTVELPYDEGRNIHKVNITMYFGETEIMVEAVDEYSGEKCNTNLQFE